VYFYDAVENAEDLCSVSNGDDDDDRRHQSTDPRLSRLQSRLVTICQRKANVRNRKVLDTIVIISPHRSTMYVDVAYCYQPSSAVSLSVGRSVCLSVTLVSPAKTAAPIEMPFELSTLVGSGNRELDEGPDPPWEGVILRGERGVPL